MDEGDCFSHVWNAGGAPVVVCLHGFTHDGSTWGSVAAALAARTGACVVAPDLPGHARNAAAIDTCRSLDEVTAWLDARLPECAHLAGYSLGGRIALHMALAAPDRWRSLTLIGADPGMSAASDRAARAARDDSLAARIEAGLADFVAEWEALPIFASLRSLPIAQRKTLRDVRCSHDPARLARALRVCSTGRQHDLWPHLPSMSLPVHLVAGAGDAKYSAIALRAASVLPRADVTIVPGAGHSVHLEAPGDITSILADAVTAS